MTALDDYAKSSRRHLIAALEERNQARARMRALETALMVIRDQAPLLNTIDPHLAARIAREALKEDD